MIRFLVRLASVATIATALTFAAEAATVTKVSEDALQPLRRAREGARVRLEALPLEEGRRTIIDLAEFEVWAPGGKILVHSDSGVQELDPPPTRFFRGSVNGDSQSFAFFALDVRGRIEGLVVTRDFKYALASHRRPKLTPGEASRDGEVDHFLTRFEAVDEMPTTNQALWACEVDKMIQRVPPPEPEEPRATVGENRHVVAANGITGSQSYEITLEIETDFNLFQNAGSNVSALTNYVTNLTGALSTIYNRDLATNVVQKFLNIYTTNTADPWTATSSAAGLYELGRVYHDATKKPTGRRTSAVALLSGVAVGSGIAWEGVVGGNDFQLTGFDFNGDGIAEWGGPYSWSGGIGNLGTVGLGTVPDPDTTVNGTLYGMPTGTQNYWPLTELAHELGHNMAGHHTHCVGITDSERIASGFTDGSASDSSSNFVDHCYANEREANCYGGASGLGGSNNYRAGSQTVFKGTIMSYCHNVFSGGGVPQSRFVFGVASEPSQHQLDDYMLNPAGPGLDGGSRNIVTAVGTFTISAISAPETVTPGSTGNVASIVATPSTGVTYVWSIVNGNITSGGTTSSITFDADEAGEVILTVSAYKSNHVGITDSRIIPIDNAIELTAPANLSATPVGAAVNLTWSAVTDATGYEVFRASAANAFASIGTTATTSFQDLSASGNTAYLYRVRATAGAVTGPLSTTDLAATTAFTDPTLTVGATKPKLAHFTELLTAINSVRALASLPAVAFTAPTPATNVTIRRAHLLDLRSALNGARSALGLPALSYTDPTITAGSTKIKAAHINELRQGIR